MKKETTGLEALGLITFAIVFGIAASAYRAYILVMVAHWFKFPVPLTFVQWFGIINIFSLMKFVYDGGKKKSESPYLDLFLGTFLITVLWGILFISHLVIN